MRSLVCLIALIAIPGWVSASPTPAATPAIEASATTRLAAAELAAAAAREAQKLQDAAKATQPAEPAKSNKAAKSAASYASANAGHRTADRQLKLREAERLRVRDKYRALQELRIAAARREQANNATAELGDASHSD